MAPRRPELGRSALRTVAACALLAVGGFFGARLEASHAALRAAPSPSVANVLVVPHLSAGITLDGDQDDLGWRGAVARTGPFLARDGSEARPQSQARAAWGDGHIYLSLYAADEDIHASHRAPDAPLANDDAFRVSFSRGDVEWHLTISVDGVITDGQKTRGGAIDYAWDSGAHVSVERDGTVNDSRDNDEEWALEVAIPLDAVGLGEERGARVGFAIERCDTLKNGKRVCAGWGDRTAAAIELE